MFLLSISDNPLPVYPVPIDCSHRLTLSVSPEKMKSKMASV